MRAMLSPVGRPSPSIRGVADPENDRLELATSALVAGQGECAPIAAVAGEHLDFRLVPVGTRVIVIDDPGFYQQTAEDVERIARTAPADEAAAIRRAGPMRYEAGSYPARYRWVRVVIASGPHADRPGRLQRHRLRPIA